MTDKIDEKQEKLDLYRASNSIQYFALADEMGCYVLNKTKTPENKPMTVVIDLGSYGVMSIPATIAPIDLCSYAPKEVLLKSANVITALNRGTLRIIPEKEALVELRNPKMQREIERIRKEQSMINISDQDTVDTTVPNAAELNRAITNANIDVVDAIESIKTVGLDKAVARLQELSLYFTDGDKAFIKEKLANIDGGYEALPKIFD